MHSCTVLTFACDSSLSVRCTDAFSLLLSTSREMSDPSDPLAPPAHPISAADDYDSPDGTAPSTYRPHDDGASSKATTRPPSASAHANDVRQTPAQRRAAAEQEAQLAAAPASEASRAAALEAQAAAAKDAAGNKLPGGGAAPAGLLSFTNDAAGLAAGAAMFGLGAAPVLAEQARVSVPRLDDLILKSLADNYHLCPAFDWLPPEYLDNLIGLITPGKLEFASACALVQSEKYWEKMCRERWGNEGAKVKATAAVPGTIPSASTGVAAAGGSSAAATSLNLALHGQSWKRLYCERHLSSRLESYHASKSGLNYSRLLKDVEACKPFVHTITLGELTSHLDLAELLFDFPHLSALSLRFGARELGMDYDKAAFGMSLSDASSLARLMGGGGGGGCSISRLELSENLLGDEAVILLMAGLHPSVNSTLTYLDLSHNKISDLGARRIAQMLDGSSGNGSGSGQQTQAQQYCTTLTDLNLSDNHLGPLGGSYFGSALSNNRGLRRLNLSLNALGDEGGSALFTGCTQHTSLKELVVSSAELEGEAGEQLLNLMRFNRSLETINLAANPTLFGSGASAAKSSAALLEALRQNEQLVSLDLRRNGVTAAVEAEVKALCAKRLAMVKQAARKAFQKEWDMAM